MDAELNRAQRRIANVTVQISSGRVIGHFTLKHNTWPGEIDCLLGENTRLSLHRMTIITSLIEPRWKKKKKKGKFVQITYDLDEA